MSGEWLSDIVDTTSQILFPTCNRWKYKGTFLFSPQLKLTSFPGWNLSAQWSFVLSFHATTERINQPSLLSFIMMSWLLILLWKPIDQLQYNAENRLFFRSQFCVESLQISWESQDAFLIALGREIAEILVLMFPCNFILSSLR